MKKNTTHFIGSLVDRAFHVWGADGFISRQGVVLGRLDERHYLVQYFDWIIGEPNDMAVVPIDRMVTAPEDARKPFTWQFYETVKHMHFFYEHHAPQRGHDE